MVQASKAPYFVDKWGFTKKAIQFMQFNSCQKNAPVGEGEIVIPYTERVARVERVAGEENIEFTQSDAGIHIKISGEEGNPVARVFRLK